MISPLLLQLSPSDAGVAGLAFTFAGTVVVGAWKALRDQQKDQTKERALWAAERQVYVQAGHEQVLAVRELADLVKMHIFSGRSAGGPNVP